MKVVALGMGTIFLPIFVFQLIMADIVVVHCRHHEAHVRLNRYKTTSASESVNDSYREKEHIRNFNSYSNDIEMHSNMMHNANANIKNINNKSDVSSDPVSVTSTALPLQNSEKYNKSSLDREKRDNRGDTEKSVFGNGVYSYIPHFESNSDKKEDQVKEDSFSNLVAKTSRISDTTTASSDNSDNHSNLLNFYPLTDIPAGRKRNRKENNPLHSDFDVSSDPYLEGQGQQQQRDTRSEFEASTHLSEYKLEYKTATVDGLRVEAVDKGVSYEGQGISIILADASTTIRLFGKEFTNHTVVRFSTEVLKRGEDCDDTPSTKTYPLTEISENNLTAIVNVVFPASKKDEYYFLCIRENNLDMNWIHVGADPWLRIKAYDRLLPMWLQAVFIGFLLLISGLFAGLTLGLLSLDTTDLKILANTGSEKERNYAKTILPLRTRGNYLLCSLVLGNVLVNSTLTILLDDLTTGIFAVMLSTAGIVVVGEIIPQAVCSRNGLAIGANTVWITKFIMLITFPLSYTFSVMLDKILGEEIGLVYNRERLKELIAVTLEHNQLETDEVNIISGALEMRKKTVETIMTRLEDVFMLPLDGILDFENLSEIRKQGYSRIPVYENERTNIVSVLFTKDLVFVDPDDRIPLKTLAQFYNNLCYFVYSDTTLDVVFKEFKDCKRGGHMAFVQRINTSREDKDPYCETIGLVTLEDVIEEMIQSEIVDETDVWTDNRSKKRMPIHQKQDFSKFVEIRNSQKTICISPQLALAAFQYLSTVVEPFKSIYVSESVLHRLLKKNILFRIAKAKDKNNVLIYENGKPTDCFTLILEGKVEVTTGKENLIFETGSFSYFGVPALMSPSETFFVPDYTVKQVSDVIILRVRRSLYHAAVQATALEKSKSVIDSNGADVHIDSTVEEQIERVLNIRTVDSVSNMEIHQGFSDPNPNLMSQPTLEEEEGGGKGGGINNLNSFYLK